MSTTLYPDLKDALNGLIASFSPTSSAQISSNDLTTKVEAIWTTLNPLDRLNEPSTAPSTAESSKSAHVANEKKLEMIRAVLEVLGRDLVVSPLTDDTKGARGLSWTVSLQARCGPYIVRGGILQRTRYESPQASTGGADIAEAVPLEPGAMFIPLLEDLVELLSVEIWRDLWGYIETRSKRFTKNMPASKGKALPLLRILNSFLRFLPRTPEDLVFRGRIHQFAGSVISVADKSAVNMRGDYNEIQTTWEEDIEREGDVDMEDKEEEQIKDDKDSEEKKSPEPDFYSTLWSLQQYFSNPPSLEGPASGTPATTPFDQFKIKTDFVLPKLFEQTQKEKATAGVETSPTSPTSRKRKRPTSEKDGSTFFHPRYLTGRRLLSHELADPSFRRQILVQYFILFQFLLNLVPGSVAKQAFTGGMPKTFVVGAEDQLWVKSKIAAITDEMKRMGRDGRTFEYTVKSVIAKETHYAQWKNEGCPESVFDVSPLDDDSTTQAAEGWRRHCRPIPAFQHKLGSRTLSALWRNGFEGIDQLKGWKRSSTIDELATELKTLEEGMEDDKAMGREPSAEDQAVFDEIRIKNTWRGLRLASHTHLRHFVSVNDKRDLHRLVASLKGLDRPSLPSKPAGETEDDAGVAAKDSEEAAGPEENAAREDGMEVEQDVEEEERVKTPELIVEVGMAAS